MEHSEALVMDREEHRLSTHPRIPSEFVGQASSLAHRPGKRGRLPYEVILGCRNVCPTGLLALLALTAGCVSLGSLVPGEDKPPMGDICQVMATWNNQVVFTPDPTHNGDPTPGIAGRLYLFGPTFGYPVAGDGCLVVDLYLDPPGTTTPIAGATPVEEWRIDKDTLHRLLRKDAIGWGYTLFLPWGTYKREINQVRLRVRYQPAQGTPLFAETPRLTLSDENTLPRVLPPQVKGPQLPAGQGTLAQKSFESR